VEVRENRKTSLVTPSLLVAQKMRGEKISWEENEPDSNHTLPPGSHRANPSGRSKHRRMLAG